VILNAEALPIVLPRAEINPLFFILRIDPVPGAAVNCFEVSSALV
jgi:hypothetical protein